MPSRLRLSAIFFSVLASAGTASCNRSNASEPEPETIIPVVAEAVRLGDIRSVVSATGLVATLPGAEFAVIAAQAGRIGEITKNVGDPVKSGELLVRVEFPSLGAESAARAAGLKAAELQFRSAQLVQGRVHGLFDRGAASQRETVDADREVVEAEAELADAREGLQRTEARKQETTIRAPFNGIVSERLHNPGDIVGTADGDTILRIVDPHQVHVIAAVLVADITRFAVGASARIVAAGRPVPELLRVVARPEPPSGAATVPVTLSFDSPAELAPGTEVGVEIDAEQRSNVPLVPAIAVVRDAKRAPAVFLASGNLARRRDVITGLADAEQVEIVSGLKPGEMVITQGLSELHDGTSITVSPPRAP